ncbi:hypothetical protein [Burkholderia anthina]|uniref:hypothetical protein n=1 Tax=Burkholderia anthina TaxID=179879 RepID=UPI00158D629B|nr:hypothetical protein [Burkholderia anthina]
MSIAAITPLPIGNALKLFLQPPASAKLWRVLRNGTGTFIDQDDANSTVVYQGDQSVFLVDTYCLTNGTAYSYCAFYFDGSAWAPSAVVAGTPAASYADQSTDVLSVVRDRLEAGLANEVLLGSLYPQDGYIPVLNSAPIFDDTPWPLVTVHVDSDGSHDRAIGESIGMDDWNALSGQFNDGQGWHARAVLRVVGWSKNPDERIALRKILRRLVIGNLDVFESFGMTLVDFHQADMDDLASYPVPIYMAAGTFSCNAPAFVTESVGLVSDVTSTPTAVFNSVGVAVRPI